jgi:hypothetical protein
MARLHEFVVALSFGLLFLPSVTKAQNFTGTYTVTNNQGGMETLTLQQDATGNVTGTMSGQGQRYQVEGVLEGTAAVGAIYDETGGVYFEAVFNGPQLMLTLIEAGPDNQPDYAKSQVLVFGREVGLAGPPAAQAGPPAGNPLAAGGDPFAGAFVGSEISLELTRAKGGYSGTLTFQGQPYPVKAQAQGGQLSGTFAASGQDYGFEASVQGNQLTLATAGTTYSLTRQGAVAQGGGGANPLGRGAPGAQLAGSGGASLLGRWSCQTPEGPAQLAFVSENQLIYNGQATQYTMGQGSISVMEEYGPAEYRYQLSGNNLTVTDPYGRASQCQRQAGAAGGMGRAGGGGGMEHLLQGWRCSYSSSPDGGFSTTQKVYFDGQGRFTTGTETGFDIPEAVGYGLSSGEGGTYRVMGNNIGDQILLTFPDGSTGVARVSHLEYNGAIREVEYEGQHYAPSLCG